MGERFQKPKVIARGSLTKGKPVSHRPVSLTMRDVVILFLGGYLGVAYSEIFAQLKSTSPPTLFGYVGAHVLSMIFGFAILMVILWVFQWRGWVRVPEELL